MAQHPVSWVVSLCVSSLRRVSMTSRPRSYAQTPKHGTSAFRVWSGRMLQHIKIRRKLGLWQVEVLHHRPGKTVDDLRLGQLIRSFRANQQRASLRLRGRASREDPGYIWEEFRVMPRRGEHFVSTQTKFLLGISISACLCSLAYSCSQAVPAAGPTCASWWERTRSGTRLAAGLAVC